MSSLGGPSIVTSGLVLHLDAANVKSFKGEPTVNLVAGGGLVGMSGITLALISTDGVWKKYSMSGTFSGGTYPYIMYVTANSFTGGLPYSTKCTILTNVMHKFNYFGTQGINYVNQPMTNGGVRSSITNSDGSFTISNVGFIYTSTTSQTGYLLTNPVDGIVFSPSTDFVWIKDLQVEQLSYTTPFVNGTRGTTVATGGGLADRSGNGNHGEIVNGPTYNSLNGGSIVFDGNDDYINCGNTTNLQSLSQITLSVWVKFSGLDYVGNTGRLVGFISKGRTDTAPGIPNTGFWFSYENRNNANTFTYTCFGNTAGGYAGGVNNFSSKSYTFTNGVWYNITVTVDSLSKGSLFINGTQLGASVTFSNLSIPNTVHNLYVGRIEYTTYNLNGNISQTLVYNRALSATEVLQNYNATKTRFI